MATLLLNCAITERMAARLGGTFDVHKLREMPDQDAWLAQHGSKISYVLTDGHYGISVELLAALPSLKAVSSYGVGYDAIDTDLTNARGIPVSHTPGVLSEEVATTGLMLMIACLRNFPAQISHARSGLWATKGQLPLARTVENRRVGILGLGRIGKCLAAKLAPFDAVISYCGRSIQDVDFRYYADLTEMARAVEVLICIAPGGAETHHLINADVLAALGPEGLLINIGRGSVVDEKALVAALESGALGGAGLDVFEDEPNIPQVLRDHPNVVVTPHIASATIETRAAMGDLAVDNLLDHLNTGKMRTPVPEAAHL